MKKLFLFTLLGLLLLGCKQTTSSPTVEPEPIPVPVEYKLFQYSEEEYPDSETRNKLSYYILFYIMHDYSPSIVYNRFYFTGGNFNSIFYLDKTSGYDTTFAISEEEKIEIMKALQFNETKIFTYSDTVELYIFRENGVDVNIYEEATISVTLRVTPEHITCNIDNITTPTRGNLTSNIKRNNITIGCSIKDERGNTVTDLNPAKDYVMYLRRDFEVPIYENK